MLNHNHLSKTELETIDENKTHEPNKTQIMELELSLNEHIYYHSYDDEIYEYYLEKIVHEYYDPEIKDYQSCNNKKICPICNNPMNIIRYQHKREQKKDYTQMQLTIENIVLEIQVFEIFKRNLCMDLYIRGCYWITPNPETHENQDKLIKQIKQTILSMKKEMQNKFNPLEVNKIEIIS